MGAIFRGRIGGVAESGHIVIVNRVVDKAGVRRALRAARDQHQRVHGVVYGYNRGGFDVLVGGVRAFCPASAMSLAHIDDPNTFVGQRCEFSLPPDKGGNKKSIIVSRRNILEKEARKKARERMAALEVGEKLKGKVLEVRDYGVLVDLGDGLDGLVHMSEVSWGRGVRPQDAAKVGDEVDVEVLKVQQASRKDRFGRVSLSMRACQPDPLGGGEGHAFAPACRSRARSFGRPTSAHSSSSKRTSRGFSTSRSSAEAESSRTPSRRSPRATRSTSSSSASTSTRGASRSRD